MKKIFYYLFLFFILQFGIHHLSSWSFYKDSGVRVVSTSQQTVILMEDFIPRIHVIFESSKDISQYEIASKCRIKTEFLHEDMGMYSFALYFLDTSCRNNHFFLKDTEHHIVEGTHFSFVFFTLADLYAYFADLSNEELQELRSRFQYLAIENGWKTQDRASTLDTIIEKVLTWREKKYLIPVPGYQLPDGRNISKFPNRPRPYRAGYTNGIHEGWDIDAPNRSDIVALDDGVILRKVDDFSWEDFDRVIKVGNISDEQKTQNLDILRWNQLWLKTLKWDVIIYAHLDSIDENIVEGDIVKRGQKLGKTGISGVPDKNYSDYHLHFEVRKNPRRAWKAGKYTIRDVMDWEWYFFWDDIPTLLEKQYSIFER